MNRVFRVFNILSSVKITVVCLFLLFILTFWGTVAHVEQGGIQLVLWVLFLNLLASGITHFAKMRGWGSVGLKISHLGVLMYLVSLFISFHGFQESYVRLLEGKETNVSSSYQEWELAYWKGNANFKQHQVGAVDVNNLKSGAVLPFRGVPWELKLQQFHPNVDAYKKGLHSVEGKILNGSGIVLLKPKEVLKEREKNIAGAIFNLTAADQRYALLLYGAESKPTPLNVQGQTYYFDLRHKGHPLPFFLKLKDFKAALYPGMPIAPSYESIVEVIKEGAKYEARVSTNNPLRERSYTFYQASHGVDVSGRKYSTLAVVKNEGQILLGIASFLVFFGLAFHFIRQSVFLTQNPNSAPA